MALKRVKDAGFLQLHIEKLLLGAGVLVLLIAAVLFILGKPFGVTLAGRDHADPEVAIDVLNSQNRKLENGLMNKSPIPEQETPKFDVEIASMIERGLDTSEPTARVASFGVTPAHIDPMPPLRPRYATVTPPVPINIEYKFGTDVFDPDFNPDQEALWELKGDRSNDFTMFVAQGEFETAKWADRLEEGAESVDGGKIPVGIWRRRFGIAGGALLRQEKDPVTGEWSETEIVAALPGQERYLPGDAAPDNIVEAVGLVARMRQVEIQAAIAQPELPWVTDFQQVVPPGADGDGEGLDGLGGFAVAGELGPNEQKVAKLQADIEKLREKQQLWQQRQRGGNPDNPRPRNPQPDNDRSERPERPERRDPFVPRIERLQEQIERIRDKADDEREKREEEQRLEEERLRRLREREARKAALENERDARLNRPAFAQVDELNLEEGATLRVYAADPTMRPGMTYRYKLVVAAINPLYAMPALAPDQLAENQSKAALLPSAEEIEAMDWIEVTTEPTIQYFYVSGTGSRGKVEVYRRVNGEMTQQSFDVSPGDVVGGVVDIEGQEADLNTGLILVDIEGRKNPLGGGNDSRMILVDESGNLVERFSSIDSKNADRRALKRELDEGPEKVLRGKEDDEENASGNYYGTTSPRY